MNPIHTWNRTHTLAPAISAVTIEYNEAGNEVSNRPMNSPAVSTIQIQVNGESREVPEGLKLPGLLEILAVDPSRVAIERNREIVRRAEWPETPVLAGDQLEVVWFVGGGSR